MRARPKAGGKIYYYYDTGKKPRREIPLGPDYVEAVRKWSELEATSQQRGAFLTFKDVADRYVREVIPTKSPRTQKDNIKELAFLMMFFNDPPARLEDIKPIHIRQYLDWRGQSAKIRANREKSLFSHIWNKAREWGATDIPNPCAGVKGFTEAGRNIYIEDAVYRAVWDSADEPLKNALDLAYLTGQRPGDVLAMTMMDIKDGCLTVEQGKTGQRLRIEVVGELAALIERINNRKQGFKIHTLALICNETGKALGKDALRSRFDKARDKAARLNPSIKAEIEAFQFRDLRAKSGTDKADSGGLREAQMLLGHASVTMTEHYVRARKGEKITPTK